MNVGVDCDGVHIVGARKAFAYEYLHGDPSAESRHILPPDFHPPMNPTRRIGRLPVVCIATVLGCAAHQSFEQAVGIDVSIDSLPHGAALVEGGNAIGTTPARYSLNDEADHVLTLQRDGFHPVEITVNGAKMKAAGGGDFFVAMAPEDFVGTSVSATDAKQLAHAAEALLKKGNAADATQFYKQMIVLQPGAAPPYKGLGIGYSKLGN